MENRMIELFIVITMYGSDGNYRVDEYKDQKACELHRDALRQEHKGDEYYKAIFCKKVQLH